MNSFAEPTDLNSQRLSLSHLKTLLTADRPDLSNHIERIHENVISISLHQKKETPYKGSDCRFQEVLCEGLGITLKEKQEKLFGNWNKKLGALALIIGSGFFTYDKLANNWKFSKEALNEINDHIVTVGSVAGGIVFLSLLYLTYRHYNPARNSQDHEELPTPETKEAKRF